MTLVPAGPLFVIEGPLPQKRFSTLLDVAQYPDAQFNPNDEHWMGGTQVYPYPTDLPGLQNPCAAGSYGEKDEGEAPPLPQFGGFTVYLPMTCTTRGMGTWDRFKERASIALEAKESYAVELELANDAAGLSQPHLNSGDADVLGGGAVSPAEGLALLETAGSLTAEGYIIHATPATVTSWDGAAFGIHKDGRILRTVLETPIAVGAGYIDTHPSNQPALTPVLDGGTQEWAYVTGPVQVMKSEIFPTPFDVKEAVDREFNVVTFRAERNFVVDWDTALLAAVLIDRSL